MISAVDVYCQPENYRLQLHGVECKDCTVCTIYTVYGTTVDPWYNAN